MVLLTGSGDNAHVFDYFAFQFTNFFHVIGITRRGWLPSSQPKNGYDVETRAADDIKVLDALGIKKAVFVGHSIAGAELSKIAVKYPSYVDKLVYLDASDLSERNTFPDIPSPFSLFTDADARSLFSLQAAYARLLAVREPIPAICLSFKFDKDGMVTGTSTPESIQAKLSAGVNMPANPPTNWADIKVPRLGIFAPPTVESKLPWYWYLRPADQAVFDARFPRLLQWFSAVIDRFSEKPSRKPHPQSIFTARRSTLCVHQQRGRGRAADAELPRDTLGRKLIKQNVFSARTLSVWIGTRWRFRVIRRLLVCPPYPSQTCRGTRSSMLHCVQQPFSIARRPNLLTRT